MEIKRSGFEHLILLEIHDFTDLLEHSDFDINFVHRNGVRLKLSRHLYCRRKVYLSFLFFLSKGITISTYVEKNVCETADELYNAL